MGVAVPARRSQRNRSGTIRCGVLGLLGILWLGLGGGAAVGQDRIAFRHLTLEEGLSQQDAHVLLEDDLGFLWIGTEDGLNRYDGHALRVFRPTPFDTTSLRGAWIVGLARDGASGLWMATEGLNHYNARTEAFTRFPMGSAASRSIGSHNLWRMLHACRLDLGAFVQDLIQTFMPLAERKALIFDVRVPPESLMLYAAPEHLEKALANLLSNALKFTPEGGAVRVTVEADAETARVAIRDSGPGIPAEDLPHIFERFYRVNESSARIQPGTGIGLALVKELVDLHGGTLTAESEAGFGSTFTVTLRQGRAHLTPDQVVEETAPWRPHPAPSLPSHAPGTPVDVDAVEDDVTTVLIVEDNPEVRAYVRRHLEPTYRVVEAADGDDGLAKARALLPDLVLSDIMMPGLDGYALCRALKADPTLATIPVLLISGETTELVPEVGADAFLAKPFNAERLRASLLPWLNRPP